MEILPPEMVRTICQKLEDEDLTRFMRTSHLNQAICLDIYQKRKERREKVWSYLEKEWDDIVEELNEAKRLRDIEKLKIIYEGLSLDPEIDDVFWEESFSESPDWLVEIIADSLAKITILDIAFVKNDKMFEKLLLNRKIDMSESDEAIARIEESLDFSPESTTFRIKLIKEKSAEESESESEED